MEGRQASSIINIFIFSHPEHECFFFLFQWDYAYVDCFTCFQTSKQISNAHLIASSTTRRPLWCWCPGSASCSWPWGFPPAASGARLGDRPLPPLRPHWDPPGRGRRGGSLAERDPGRGRPAWGLRRPPTGAPPSGGTGTSEPLSGWQLKQEVGRNMRLECSRVRGRKLHRERECRREMQWKRELCNRDKMRD